MGLWYLTPANDRVFADGMRSANDAELQDKLHTLEGLQASGFKVTMRIKTLKKEINGRRSRHM